MKERRVLTGLVRCNTDCYGFSGGACEARSRKEEEGDEWPSSTTTNAEIVHNPHRQTRHNLCYSVLVMLGVLLVGIGSPGRLLWAGKGTRTEVRGLRGAVTAGHPLVADVGMEIFKQGGNAVDSGVAMLLAASVVEFNSYGFGGEMPTLIYSPRDRRVVAVNGNTRAPKAASIGWFRKQGYQMIPADGFMPAGVCAVPAAIVLSLERYGTLSFSEIARGAIRLAEGFPVDERWRKYVGREESEKYHGPKTFRTEWPSSAAVLLHDGRLPGVGEITSNPDLARTFRRLAQAEKDALKKGADRKSALRAVHDYFYKGPIAQQLVEFSQAFKVRDGEGGHHHGLLTTEDFADYEARIQEPWSIDYRGYQVYKCGPWTQGPVFLQQLALLEGYDLSSLKHNSADYLHLWLETAKLAHADKEKYYGDPDFVYVPRQGLLSKGYAKLRRQLLDWAKASLELRPGDPFPFDAHPEKRPTNLSLAPVEPGLKDDGTSGVRAVDSHGTIFSSTPSGGWPASSPIVPGLGFCLGSRVQMFYLEEGLAKSLAPGKQPSTSLTPSLVMKDGRPWMGFGMPGGDKQDQGTLQFFLNVVDFDMGLQDALDAPKVWTQHFPGLFYPHRADPGRAYLEGRLANLDEIVVDLRQRGHKVTVASPWNGDNTMVVMIDPRTGTLVAATNPRMEGSTALAW